MKKFSLYLCAAILFAAIGVAVGLYVQSKNADPRQKALTSLFDQTLTSPNGQPQALSQWQGKALIINFWATWCTPCVAEMPELLALQKELQSTQIIGIGIDTQANIVQFAEKLHIDYPLYVADTRIISLLRQMGNPSGGLPFTVLVGANGAIKKVYVGQLKFNELRKDLNTFQMK
jgi:thiol-disulfide isomerase/thioredoxin